MKRYLVPVVVLAFCAPTPAQAVTHAPCTYRYAGPPSVQLVQGGQSTLAGSGTVGGCPSPVGSESVTVTVSLERYDGTTWTVVSTASVSRGWSRITRGARQVSATATATCIPGPWRTHLTSYDSGPIDVTSTVVTFAAGDSGVCGSYGGGD